MLFFSYFDRFRNQDHYPFWGQVILCLLTKTNLKFEHQDSSSGAVVSEVAAVCLPHMLNASPGQGSFIAQGQAAPGISPYAHARVTKKSMEWQEKGDES